jgi:ElaB/YqjD/DUF883 family membrane-anchored ribosome-binding protein
MNVKKIKGDKNMESSTEKLTEALDLINEALKQKKEEMWDLITDKYSDIKEVFEEKVEEGMKTVNKAKKNAYKAVEEGEEKIVETAKSLEKGIKDNPWPYLGGVAFGFLLLGFIMGGDKDRK